MTEPRWLIKPGDVTERSPQEDDQIDSPEPIASEGRYKGKTAAQWRAVEHSREAIKCAQLAEKDGIWEFPALFTLTGALVPQSTWVKTKKGKWIWRIGKGDTVSWFDPSRALSGARRRANDAAKGYQVGLVRARGYVGVRGTGYFIGKVDDSPVEIVDNGALGTQYTDR